MHYLEPFLPDLSITPDHDATDTAQEIQVLGIIQGRIEGFLKGNLVLDDLDQCLAQFGINPFDYWDIVADNIDAVIDREETLEDVDTLAPVLVDQYGSPISSIYGLDRMEPCQA